MDPKLLKLLSNNWPMICNIHWFIKQIFSEILLDLLRDFEGPSNIEWAYLSNDPWATPGCVGIGICICIGIGIVIGVGVGVGIGIGSGYVLVLV